MQCNLDIGEETSISSIEISNDVVVTVDVLVDASNVVDANTAVEAVVESIRNQDDSYDITSQGITVIRKFCHINHFYDQVIFKKFNIVNK